MRQRRTLYNDNRINSPGRYNNYNVHAPNVRTPKYIKQTLTELKEKQTDLLKEILFAPIPYPEGSLLILDEVCAALEQDVLDEATVWDTVVRKKSPIEIIMTGRHPKGWMLAASDYVTELKEIQHPYHDGLTARAGIEF